MITEDISDVIKGSFALGPPAVTFMGVPLQDWMYYVSIFAALLLICERLPAAYRNIKEMIQWVKRNTYARSQE